ncbi:site-specific integrase [Parabacteroides sp.]
MSKRKNHRQSKSATTFYDYATECIRKKRLAGRDNAADLYRTTRNRVCAFLGGRDLYFQEITPGLIDRFIAYLQAAGLRVNTINTYLSNFRALYNQACRDGLLFTNAISPFMRLNLKREMSGSRALDGGLLREIASLRPADPNLAHAVDYCLFCYLACGMPFVDLAHLTVANIYNNEIVYKRKKTGTLIRIRITPGMRRLMDKYANDSSPYIFPVLSREKKVGHEEYKSILRSYNNSLKEIGNSLSRPIHLTSYVSRHTWATDAQRKHVPLSIISQALGHTSEKTTRFYLATLDQSELNQANAKVTAEVDSLLAAG